MIYVFSLMDIRHSIRNRRNKTSRNFRNKQNVIPHPGATSHSEKPNFENCYWMKFYILCQEVFKWKHFSSVGSMKQLFMRREGYLENRCEALIKARLLFPCVWLLNTVCVINIILGNVIAFRFCCRDASLLLLYIFFFILFNLSPPRLKGRIFKFTNQ